MSRRQIFALLLSTAACTSSSCPSGFGDSCGPDTPCSEGLACESGTCVGAATVAGVVGHLFEATGDFTVVLVDPGAIISGVTCGSPVSSTTIEGAVFPAAYTLRRVPAGRFRILAYSAPIPGDEDNAYFGGGEELEVDTNGHILQNGFLETSINLFMSGIGPYACATQ